MLIEGPKKALLSYISALEVTTPAEVPAGLRRFAAILGLAENVRTSTFVSDLSKTAIPASNDGTIRLKKLIPSLQGLAGFLTEIGANKSLVKDVGAILDLVHQHRDASLREFGAIVKRQVKTAPSWIADRGVELLDEELVTDYLKRLERALGNDHAFRKLYDEIKSDRRVSRIEAVELASRFLSPIAPSTPRTKALQTVMHRHEKLMDNRAASRAIGGIGAHELR